MENSDKNDSSEISAVFATRENFDSQKVFSKKNFFGIQRSTFFRFNNFQNIWAIKLILFLKMCKISCRLQKSNKTLRNIF